jgi:hypothetical protein
MTLRDHRRFVVSAFITFAVIAWAFVQCIRES